MMHEFEELKKLLATVTSINNQMLELGATYNNEDPFDHPEFREKWDELSQKVIDLDTYCIKIGLIDISVDEG